MEEYAEKEQFITDAYRQRQKELEELDKQQESALEETAEGGPVTDMAVFYRQVLENATALPALPPDNSDSLKHAPSMSALLKSDGQEEKARLEKDIASGILHRCAYPKKVEWPSTMQTRLSTSASCCRAA